MLFFKHIMSSRGAEEYMYICTCLFLHLPRVVTAFLFSFVFCVESFLTISIFVSPSLSFSPLASSTSYTAQRLLDAGARIPETKDRAGSGGAATVDGLQQSVGLVEQYNAIATPAYVTQAYSDPIDKAFQLTKTLMAISYAEV